MTKKQKKILDTLDRATSYGIVFLLTVMILCVGTRICDKTWNTTELDVALVVVADIITIAVLRVVLVKIFAWRNKKRAIEAMKIMIKDVIEEAPAYKVDEFFEMLNKQPGFTVQDVDAETVKSKRVIEVID